MLAACTLTHTEYEPPLVERGALAGSNDAEPDVVACADGAGCCMARPCADGESCTDGRCSTKPDAGGPPCVGPDCPGSMAPVALAPSCDDAARNGDETGTDCGGSCPQRCGIGETCVGDSDCAAGSFCAEGGLCAEVSCTDTIRNGNETSPDCGGGSCPACADGATCGAGADCQSLVCGDGGTCSAPSCDDAQPNGDETGTDCGGPCPNDCDDGAVCEQNGDCQSGVCGALGCAEGVARCCQAAACDDEVRNGSESGVDCGTPACGQCSLGDACLLDVQCDTGLCQAAVCVVAPPRCDDNMQNGTETGTDCGGPDLACRRCNAGEVCESNPDCVNQFCLAGLCT